MLSTPKQNISHWLLAATALSYCLQLIWFGSRSIHQIDIDGIDYIGIARHLRNHQFYSAINDFRSPLMSWMIAAGSFFGGDMVRVGKIVNIGSYLLCGVLIFFFANTLWHSELAGSAAALWFSLSRGLSAQAVDMVTPDFLLAALVLVYFMVLLRCFRTEHKKYWGWLGGVHALAFLAKSFALPWLALITMVSILLPKPRRKWLTHLALAGILPLLVATGWGAVLHFKYGAFTTGTQFKFNFLQRTQEAHDGRLDKPDSLLADTRPFIDENNVNDPMPPGSRLWQYQIDAKQSAPEFVWHEAQNLPRALRELLIVVTPGGVVAFVFVVMVLVRRRRQSPVLFAMAAAVVLGTVSLLLAYCMLVFDSRYLYPIIPLVLAIAVGFLELMGPELCLWRRTMIAVIALGVLGSLVYSSSPFRTLGRDFQIVCYRAGESLKAHPGSTVISIGVGPYQERGVGWEAGYKSAYFGDRRLIGATPKVPDVNEIPALLRDISTLRPDAILVWGKPGNTQYETLIEQIVYQYSGSFREPITDPFYGEVGSALYARGSHPFE